MAPRGALQGVVSGRLSDRGPRPHAGTPAQTSLSGTNGYWKSLSNQFQGTKMHLSKLKERREGLGLDPLDPRGGHCKGLGSSPSDESTPHARRCERGGG